MAETITHRTPASAPEAGASATKIGSTGGQIMTIQEVAEYLRVHVQVVYRLAQRKRIPCQKIGRSYRFFRPAIEAWVAEQQSPDLPRKRVVAGAG